jgi:hypothetical protein
MPNLHFHSYLSYGAYFSLDFFRCCENNSIHPGSSTQGYIMSMMTRVEESKKRSMPSEVNDAYD